MLAPFIDLLQIDFWVPAFAGMTEKMQE